ncbi:hypothetical protein ABT093_02480 [Kitasatospora sp. NPDC002551]|uniref:hypothetical protein n=1 Tax=Kitasatospora sp. NPDC002551 TaxID=3154539 RepID=UPI00331CC242
MTGPEDTDWDPGAPEGDEDREVADELRVLLQLAAPHLPAPEDRMERVLARAARTRRRRRRAALAGGLAVGLTAAALAAAPALAPGPGGTALGPAASGPALGAVPPGARPSSVPPSAAPGAGSTGARTVRFTVLDDVAVDVPGGWYDLTVLPGVGQLDPVGYLASQRLAGGTGCPTRDGRQESVCLTAGTLLDDGVLVTLRLIRDPNAVGKYLGEVGTMQNMARDKDCEARGGTLQLFGSRAMLLNGRPEVVQLTACASRPTDETLTALSKLAASLRPAATAPDGSTVPTASVVPGGPRSPLAPTP